MTDSVAIILILTFGVVAIIGIIFRKWGNKMKKEDIRDSFNDDNLSDTMTFMIEKNIFLRRQFDFIRALALKEVHQC